MKSQSIWDDLKNKVNDTVHSIEAKSVSVPRRNPVRTARRNQMNATLADPSQSKFPPYSLSTKDNEKTPTSPSIILPNVTNLKNEPTTIPDSEPQRQNLPSQGDDADELSSDEEDGQGSWEPPSHLDAFSATNPNPSTAPKLPYMSSVTTSVLYQKDVPSRLPSPKFDDSGKETADSQEAQKNVILTNAIKDIFTQIQWLVRKTLDADSKVDQVIQNIQEAAVISIGAASETAKSIADQVGPGGLLYEGIHQFRVDNLTLADQTAKRISNVEKSIENLHASFTQRLTAVEQRLSNYAPPHPSSVQRQNPSDPTMTSKMDSMLAKLSALESKLNLTTSQSVQNKNQKPPPPKIQPPPVETLTFQQISREIGTGLPSKARMVKLKQQLSILSNSKPSELLKIIQSQGSAMDRVKASPGQFANPDNWYSEDDCVETERVPKARVIGSADARSG
jgi:hypothetical protein